MKTTSYVVAAFLALIALSAAPAAQAETAAECKALLDATFVNSVRGEATGCRLTSLSYSDGNIRQQMCKDSCKSQFQAQKDFCEASATAGDKCKAAYDTPGDVFVAATGVTVADYCAKIIQKKDTANFCTKADSVVAECKANFQTVYGSKTECHNNGNYSNVTRDSTCEADLTNSFKCTEALLKLFRQVGVSGKQNFTTGPQVCDGREIYSRLTGTIFGGNSDTGDAELGSNWGYNLCNDANYEACRADGKVYAAYFSIWGKENAEDPPTHKRDFYSQSQTYSGLACPTAAEKEAARVSKCDSDYSAQPGSRELMPGYSSTYMGVTTKSACVGKSVHDMVCSYYDVNNTKCEKAKTDLYAWCIDNSGGCAYNDTRNVNADYAKNYCRHIVEIKQGTMKCNMPPTPSPPPLPSPPSPPPSPPPRGDKVVVSKMIVSVEKELDQKKLQDNAMGAVIGGSTPKDIKVTVTYGATVAAMLQVGPDVVKEADVKKNMAAAFKVPEAQIMDIQIRSLSSSGRHLLQDVQSLAQTAKGMVQATVAAPDFATAKAVEANAKAIAGSALSKIDPKVYVAESRTSATIAYEMTVGGTASSVQFSITKLVAGTDINPNMDGAILTSPTPIQEKSSMPATPAPADYVKPTTVDDSGASRVAATAIALFAAAVALFFA